MKPKYYVVFKGKRCGVFFDTWENVKRLVEGHSNNVNKGFESEESARIAYGIYRGLSTKIKKA
jgi:viroplasmin and RNaseH domain-containing protein